MQYVWVDKEILVCTYIHTTKCLHKKVMAESKESNWLHRFSWMCKFGYTSVHAYVCVRQLCVAVFVLSGSSGQVCWVAVVEIPLLTVTILNLLVMNLTDHDDICCSNRNFSFPSRIVPPITNTYAATPAEHLLRFIKKK